MRVCFLYMSAIILAVGLLSCGGAQRDIDTGPRGTVRFEADVADAILEVDEVRVGPVGLFREHGLQLRPGSHRILVKRAGYFDFYQIIDIREDQLQVVSVQLRPVPD